MNLESIAIVLVATTHSGNIGGTARAMANMGLSRLRLVQPRAVIDAEARSRASGAEYILDAATIHESLADALGDAVYVLGTTARRRDSRWKQFDAESAAVHLLAVAASDNAPVAVVFGRESSGLTNTELDYCDALLSIPVATAFASINLATAVAVVGYEIRKCWMKHQDEFPQAAIDIPASVAERERFFDHLADVLTEVDFIKDHSREKLMRKIRHLYMKAHPNSEEVAILRGILSAIHTMSTKDIKKNI